MESYLGMPGNITGKTFDAYLEFTSVGTTLTGNSVSKVVDIGTGLFESDLVVAVTALTGAASVRIEFSATADFAVVVPNVEVVALKEGTNIIPFRNAQGASKPYGFARLSYIVGTSITLAAFMGKR